jgi:hypothetical protein
VTSQPAAQIVVAAVIGGTISEASGGNFGNGAITMSFQYAFAKAFEAMPLTGSSSTSDVVDVQVPSSIKIEAQNYATREDAARAAGLAYGAQGVARQQEVDLGLTQDPNNGWGYLTPGWGPVGATRVNATPLLRAYIAAGYRVNAWMHGHFDSQLNFSATDFALAWHKGPTFLVNRNGDVRSLTDSYLQAKASQLPIPQRNLSGLQQAYWTEGLPGVGL